MTDIQPETGAGRWVPVSERLPVRHIKRYLVAMADGSQDYLYPPSRFVRKQEWYQATGLGPAVDMPDVTHWYDLPPVPKPKSELLRLAEAVDANRWDKAHHIATGEHVCTYCHADERECHKPGCEAVLARAVIAREGQS